MGERRVPRSPGSLRSGSARCSLPPPRRRWRRMFAEGSAGARQRLAERRRCRVAKSDEVCASPSGKERADVAAEARVGAGLSGFGFAGCRCPFPEPEGVKRPAAAHLCAPCPIFMGQDTGQKGTAAHLGGISHSLCGRKKAGGDFPRPRTAAGEPYRPGGRVSQLWRLHKATSKDFRPKIMAGSEQRAIPPVTFGLCRVKLELFSAFVFSASPGASAAPGLRSRG